MYAARGWFSTWKSSSFMFLVQGKIKAVPPTKQGNTPNILIHLRFFTKLQFEEKSMKRVPQSYFPVVCACRGLSTDCVSGFVLCENRMLVFLSGRGSPLGVAFRVLCAITVRMCFCLCTPAGEREFGMDATTARPTPCLVLKIWPKSAIFLSAKSWVWDCASQGKTCRFSDFVWLCFWYFWMGGGAGKGVTAAPRPKFQNWPNSVKFPVILFLGEILLARKWSKKSCWLCTIQTVRNRALF